MEANPVDDFRSPWAVMGEANLHKLRTSTLISALFQLILKALLQFWSVHDPILNALLYSCTVPMFYSFSKRKSRLSGDSFQSYNDYLFVIIVL